MSLTLRNGQSTIPSRYIARDPFHMARELLAWDPFFGGRPASAFSPAFEVKETNDSFVLKADLPGVDETDLDLAVHNGVLTVSGSRPGRGAQGRRELRALRASVRLVHAQFRAARYGRWRAHRCQLEHGVLTLDDREEGRSQAAQDRDQEVTDAHQAWV